MLIGLKNIHNLLLLMKLDNWFKTFLKAMNMKKMLKKFMNHLIINF